MDKVAHRLPQRSQLSQDPAVGARLKEIRFKTYNPRTGKYYTQDQLARKWTRETGEKIHQSSLKNYETNRRETPHRFLIFYKNLVEGYSIDYILTGRHPNQEDVVKRVLRALK